MFTLALAVVHGLFGMLRPHPGLSTAFLSAAAFAAGGRTLISSRFALATPSAVRPAVMSLRASTMQFGYCIGSIAGGIALALGGFRALGATMGLVFFGAAVTLAYQPASQRSRGRRSRLVLSGA